MKTITKLSAIFWLIFTLVLGVACNTSQFKGSTPQKAPPPETNVKEFTQAAFPLGSKSYVQGSQGDDQVDSFEQGKWGNLDLLIVIDSSRSMAEEQSNLSGKMQPLLSHLEKSDWRIGVITTDPSAFGYPIVIKKDDVGSATKFANAIRAGTNGSGIERGIYQGVNGLKGGLLGGSWVRSDSTIAVLIVSDEDNCAIEDDGNGNPVYNTSDNGCHNDDVRNGNYLLNHLSSMRTLGKDAKVYGLIWHPTQSSGECSTALNKANYYASVISRTAGTWGSICAADYSSTLSRISEDISQVLKYEFPLAFTPEDGSLKVYVDGADWPYHELVGDVIKFTKPPPFGSKVEVKYKHGKEGELWSTFPLDERAVDGSFNVSINGQTVDSSDYTYDEKYNRIKFNQTPPDKAKILIEYKEAVELDTDFDVGPDRKSVSVKVNGKSIKDFKYDSRSGIVRIAPPPPEGAEIRIYFKEE